MGNLWKWVEVIPGDRDHQVPTAITLPEINLLTDYATGNDCLEVGSAWGYSAIMMALRGAKSVTSVDYHQADDSNDFGDNTLAGMRMGIEYFGVGPKVAMICKSSQEALPALAAQGRRFGLVFVDANHAYDAVMHDISWARRLADDDGFIACHDYGGIEDVTRAVDETFPDGPDQIAGTMYITRVRKNSR